MISTGTCKIYISPFSIDKYFPFYNFITSNLQLLVLDFIPHTSQIYSSNSINLTRFENGKKTRVLMYHVYKDAKDQGYIYPLFPIGLIQWVVKVSPQPH